MRLTSAGLGHADLRAYRLHLLPVRRRRCLLRLFLKQDQDHLLGLAEYIDPSTFAGIGKLGRHANMGRQWCSIANLNARRPPNPRSHPSHRQDRFFDSAGPGGIRTPRPQPNEARKLDTAGGQLVEIDQQHIKQFAHYGYVYTTLLATGASLGLSPDDEFLISGGGDGIINIWSLNAQDSGAIHSPKKLQDRTEEGNSVLSLALDGSFLYAGRSSGQVTVWDLETKQLIRRLEAHHDEILAISVGRGLVLAAALDGRVVVCSSCPHLFLPSRSAG